MHTYMRIYWIWPKLNGAGPAGRGPHVHVRIKYIHYHVPGRPHAQIQTFILVTCEKQIHFLGPGRTPQVLGVITAAC